MTFDSFFHEFKGVHPFPFQSRLCSEVMKSGHWPPSIEAPTASGKTDAVLLTFVYTLAFSEHKTPRRFFYVVDRRPVVDEGFFKAQALANFLTTAQEGTVAFEVAQRLRSFGTGNPLDCFQLRGGIYRDESWVLDPRQPLIIFSTVDQVGSKLLCQGYGVSNRTRSIHAGLVANDSLILQDEVQCSPAFSELLRACLYYREGQSLVIPFETTTMSATLREPGVFQVEQSDLDHPVFKQRFDALKKTRLMETEDIPAQLIAEAESFVKQGKSRILVITNRVASAKKIHNSLSKKHECVLVMGRMRPLDRDEVYRGCSRLLRAESTRSSLEKPLIVVSTQSLECGPDLDFDALVTECADLTALTQRFGRLNRLGLLTDDVVRGIIVGKSETKGKDPIYGSALQATWSWLKTKVREGLINLSPSQLKTWACEEDLSPLRASLPEFQTLLPAHLDRMFQTTSRMGAQIPVQPYLHGVDQGNPDVYVVWRKALPQTDDIKADTEAWKTILNHSPPSSAEAMPVPLYLVSKWLLAKKQVSVQEGEHDGDLLTGETSASKQGSVLRRRIMSWEGPKESSFLKRAEDVTPGMTLVVPFEDEGWSDFGAIPKNRIIDLGAQANFERRRLVLRVHPNIEEDVGSHFHALSRACQDGIAAVRETLTSLSWDAPIDTIVQGLAKDPSLRIEDYFGTPGAFILRGSWAFLDDTDTYQFDQVVSLESHNKGVGSYAQEVASGLGVPSDVEQDVFLAGFLHDIGKADPRFQSLLYGGDEIAAVNGPLVAKSTKNIKNQRWSLYKELGLPRGWRHEMASLEIIEQSPDLLSQAADPDLVRHLVSSHHGHCRPHPPATLDEGEDLEVSFKQEDVNLSGNTRVKVDSEVVERFWRLTKKYGWWGLAYLEALLRTADWRRSNDERKGL